MADETISSRRSFLKGGAIIAAPLAVAVPGAALAADERAERLRRLEDEAAIRTLHRDWLGRVNRRVEAGSLFAKGQAAGCFDESVCAVRPVGDEAMVEIASDGTRASVEYLLQIESESRMAAQNTFAQMALAQGGGVTRMSEQRIINVAYVKTGERWLIERVT